jgi:hypothetical protein
MGDLSYTVLNDAGGEQTMILCNCLYVPDCVVHLICPRQIGAETIYPLDGLNATRDHTILTEDVEPTTICYDTLSQLPVLYSKPGISSYLCFHTHLIKPIVSSDHAKASPDASIPTKLNLTARQKQKSYLHDMCAHKGFQNMNTWIHKGLFPGVNPNLTVESDPICPSYIFGKARQKCHNSHVGHINSNHTKPGKGVSSDGLESSTPGQPFTTKGSPSKTRYHYVSFWVDHHSTLKPLLGKHPLGQSKISGFWGHPHMSFKKNFKMAHPSANGSIVLGKESTLDPLPVIPVQFP